MDTGDVTKPEVSVVMPVRNAAATIASQLEALAGQDFDRSWDLIVVDNGSTDASADIALSWSDRVPRLQVVAAAGRPGVSHARNVGFGACRGDLVALCDGDDVVAPGWLGALVAASVEADLVGGGFDEVSLNGGEAGAWRRPRPIADLPVSMGFLRYAVGSNCCIRREVVEKLDGWNEEYLSGNDTEFSWRAQLAGFRLAYAPEAVVRYRYRSSLSSLAEQAYCRGLAKPRLYRDFRNHGVSGRSWWRSVWTLGWLVLHLPGAVVSAGQRGAWVQTAAAAAGRLRASVEVGVVYL